MLSSSNKMLWACPQSAEIWLRFPGLCLVYIFLATQLNWYFSAALTPIWKLIEIGLPVTVEPHARGATRLLGVKSEGFK